MGGRSRINSSALADNVPVFDPQAEDDDDESSICTARVPSAVAADVPESSSVENTSDEISTIQLRSLAR